MLDKTQYNPDVLNCLANLSSDEVFTPPHIVHKMLDILPQDLFKSTTTTFLDPVCKSGVFLREITKRLLAGLETQIPDLQTRINHIFKNQIFGIAITDLTALMARRTVYCAKKANGDKSVTDIFDTEAGNIIFETQPHEFKGEKCVFCGASQAVYDRDETHETHAYPFIHTHNPEDIFKMKFDVIIGNPPYQLKDGGASASASPIYHKFIQQAKKLNPRFLTMIIPARWYAGGKGLDDFRKEMLNDKRISHLVDFINETDCFPNSVEIKGGICYFLWERDSKNDECEIVNIIDGVYQTPSKRILNEYDIFIRMNAFLPILKKVSHKNEASFSDYVSSRKPFGLATNFSKFTNVFEDDFIKLYNNNENGYIDKKYINSNFDLIEPYKLLISKAYNGGSKYPHYIINKPIISEKNSCCTETYIILYHSNNIKIIENVCNYVKSKFFRFLVSARKITQDAPKGVYQFVPLQDFSESWTDEKLYAKYGLTADEIAFIESMIRPME